MVSYSTRAESIAILNGQTNIFPSEGHFLHVYGHEKGIAGVLVSDEEYPKLAAQQILNKICDEFLAKYPSSAWVGATEANTFPLPALAGYIKDYQDPNNADSIMKIQRELDETKIVLHQTIESVLQRGEKIDSLVAKSDGLSAQSKMFYTQVGVPCLFGFV